MTMWEFRSRAQDAGRFLEWLKDQPEDEPIEEPFTRLFFFFSPRSRRKAVIFCIR